MSRLTFLSSNTLHRRYPTFIFASRRHHYKLPPKLSLASHLCWFYSCGNRPSYNAIARALWSMKAYWSGMILLWMAINDYLAHTSFYFECYDVICRKHPEWLMVLTRCTTVNRFWGKSWSAFICLCICQLEVEIVLWIFFLVNNVWRVFFLPSVPFLHFYVTIKYIFLYYVSGQVPMYSKDLVSSYLYKYTTSTNDEVKLDGWSLEKF